MVGEILLRGSTGYFIYSFVIQESVKKHSVVAKVLLAIFWDIFTWK